MHKVGTASPRLEIKFAPLVVEDWEQVLGAISENALLDGRTWSVLLPSIY